jgi:cation diffusion facilitator family transporter
MQTADGLRAVWVSFGMLAITVVFELVILATTRSVALLADFVHNATDMLTAVPLALAFAMSRRDQNRSYTYGYGRAEDLASLVIAAVLVASTIMTTATAVDHLVHPHTPTHLWLLASAGMAGIVGNELAARYRIRVGQRIGSMALVADGQHARTDALASAAVVLGALGTYLGFTRADAVAGIVVSITLLSLAYRTMHRVVGRAMDRVEPTQVDAAASCIAAVPGVEHIESLRLRWLGRTLRAEVDICADPDLTLSAAHAIAEEVRHALLHGVDFLTAATVHVCPGKAGVEHAPHAEVDAHKDC